MTSMGISPSRRDVTSRRLYPEGIAFHSPASPATAAHAGKAINGNPNSEGDSNANAWHLTCSGRIVCAREAIMRFTLPWSQSIDRPFRSQFLRRAYGRAVGQTPSADGRLRVHHTAAEPPPVHTPPNSGCSPSAGQVPGHGRNGPSRSPNRRARRPACPASSHRKLGTATTSGSGIRSGRGVPGLAPCVRHAAPDAPARPYHSESSRSQ